MKSKSTTKEFEPRSVAVANLYVENQRLQRKCHAYKRQIKGMQRSLREAKLTLENVLLKRALAKTSNAPTQTVEEFGVPSRGAFITIPKEHA